MQVMQLDMGFLDGIRLWTERLFLMPLKDCDTYHRRSRSVTRIARCRVKTLVPVDNLYAD